MKKPVFLITAVFMILISISSASAIVTISNGIYNVTVADSDNAGTYTVATGDNHPNPDEDVLYGGAIQYPRTSYLTVRDETNDVSGMIEYTSLYGDQLPSTGYTQENLDNFYPVVNQIGTNQIDTTWQVTDTQGSPLFNILQSITIIGTTYEDSMVEITTTITNLGREDRIFSIRYLWDTMVADNDASEIRPSTPGGEWSAYEREWTSPTFEDWEVTDYPLNPTFSIFGSTSDADIIKVTYLAFSLGNAFDYTVEPTRYIYDSAVLYYWMSMLLEPSQSNSVTAFLFTKSAPEMADISVTKTVDNLSPEVGEIFHFLITVINNGPDDATNVTVTDLMPAGLKLEGFDAQLGDFDPDTGIWVISNLVTDYPVTLELEVVALESGTLTNEISVTAEESDPDLTNNLASATFKAEEETSEPGFGPRPHTPYHSVPMQPTSIPLALLVIGLMAVLGGTIYSRK